jgi:hypothetical protein
MKERPSYTSLLNYWFDKYDKYSELRVASGRPLSMSPGLPQLWAGPAATAVVVAEHRNKGAAAPGSSGGAWRRGGWCDVAVVQSIYAELGVGVVGMRRWPSPVVEGGRGRHWTSGGRWCDGDAASIVGGE